MLQIGPESGGTTASESFAASPGEAKPVDCLDNLRTLDVNLEREDLMQLSQSAFGTQDPWSLLDDPVEPEEPAKE